MCCILGRMKNRNEESAIVRVYVHLYSDTERGWALSQPLSVRVSGVRCCWCHKQSADW